MADIMFGLNHKLRVDSFAPVVVTSKYGNATQFVSLLVRQLICLPIQLVGPEQDILTNTSKITMKFG